MNQLSLDLIYNSPKVICWFSCGITSAIACKLAIEKYGRNNIIICYFEIKSAHPDNERFIKDCEKWFKMKINRYSNPKYKDHFEVIEKTKYINGVAGARCTLELKKNIRFELEKTIPFCKQVFGFEYTKKEVNRALRFKEQYQQAQAEFPLIDAKLTKEKCLYLLEKANIKKPKMYELGYHNNNCIGCVKGGKGYWNKIKKDFPFYFKRMQELEQKLNRSCIKDKFLKDLQPDEGRHDSLILPDCGNFCDIEFTEIEHKKLKLYNFYTNDL